MHASICFRAILCKPNRFRWVRIMRQEFCRCLHTELTYLEFLWCAHSQPSTNTTKSRLSTRLKPLYLGHQSVYRCMHISGVQDFLQNSLNLLTFRDKKFQPWNTLHIMLLPEFIWVYINSLLHRLPLSWWFWWFTLNSTQRLVDLRSGLSQPSLLLGRFLFARYPHLLFYHLF